MKKAKEFLLLGIGAVCLAIGMLLFQINGNYKPIPHSNILDSQLSLNPHRPPIASAKDTDPEFREAAFNVETPGRNLVSSQLAAVVKSFKSLFSLSEPPRAEEYGTWLWTPVLEMTPEYIDSIIDGAQENGVNAIYLSIDSYLDIFTMPKGPEREAEKEKFEAVLDSFIAQAGAHGIKVDAEAGWQNWAEEGNAYKALAVVNFVKSYNARHEARFRGFQYDVEPYLLPRYEKEKESVLKNFVSLIDKTEVFLSDSDLGFTVVVPDFYDGEDQATPKFSYKGQKDYVFGHLLSILDRRPESTVIVMSYRNFAHGQDGAIEITQNEMRTAAKNFSNTRIIVAQEIGEFPPPYITFHNTSKSYMLSEVSKIDAAFSQSRHFGGLAFHYVNALLAME